MALPEFDREFHIKHPPRMSFEDYLRWVPTTTLAEWVDGEVTILTVTFRHAQLSMLLLSFFGSFLSMTRLGEVFYGLFVMRARPDGPARAPDIKVILHEHGDRIGRQGIQGPPDLIVELVLDETAETDEVIKVREYEADGVTEYVLVDARDEPRGFAFYRLDEGGRYRPVEPDERGRYHSTVLPGLWLDPRWFAREELPDPEELLLEVTDGAYFDWVMSKRPT